MAAEGRGGAPSTHRERRRPIIRLPTRHPHRWAGAARQPSQRFARRVQMKLFKMPLQFAAHALEREP